MIDLSKSPAIVRDNSIVSGINRVERMPDNAFLNGWIYRSLDANSLDGLHVAMQFWGIKN